MKKLSKNEEQLMGYLWKQKKSFLKDLIVSYPKPHPAKTTIATLLKRMQNKGYVEYHVFGNSRQYIPLIEKEDYFSVYFKEIISHHFNNSIQELGLFLVKSLKLKRSDLDAFKKIIELEVSSKQNKDAMFF